MKKANVTYQHGNKYTKAWIGNCKYEGGGGFSLYHQYNGGRFTSKRGIEDYIYNVLPKELNELGYELGSVELIEEE